MMLLAPWLVLAVLTADLPTRMPPRPTPAAAPEADEVWHLTLPEAIRLGLENSEVVRVIDAEIKTVRIGEQEVPIGTFEPDLAGPVVPPGRSTGLQGNGPLGDVPPAGVGPHGVGVKIARLNADSSAWNFKEAVEAHVRSIEQIYWALAALQINLWSRETAVRLGEEILRSERAGQLEGGDRTGSNVKEAEEQLVAFKLNLVTATSDLVETERRLRNILGLPAADNRRIVADTAPLEAKYEVDRAASLKQMLASRPDILQQREVVADASLLEAVAATPEVQTQAHNRRERQQDHLNSLARKAIQDLDWSVATIDASYKEFRASQGDRAAAQKQLEVQRGFSDQGRVAVNCLLDAVTQYANAISQEALAKCTYNTAIASFEEVRGTLLAADGINLGAGASPRRSLPGTPAAAPADASPPAGR